MKKEDLKNNVPQCVTQKEAVDSYQYIFDALPQLITVVDEKCLIRYVNKSWRLFLSKYTFDKVDKNGVGESVLHVFPLLFEVDGSTVREIELGLWSVIQGEIPIFELEYDCKIHGKPSLFVSKIASFAGPEWGGAVMTHSNITNRNDALKASLDNELRQEIANTMLSEESHEVKSLEKYTAATTSTSITARYFGMGPLKEMQSGLFNNLVLKMDTIINKAVENQMFKVDNSFSTDLTSFANELGHLNLNPRDVIDIYLSALKLKSKKSSPRQMQAYTTEARLVVLEVMGNLVSYYRNFSFGFIHQGIVVGDKQKSENNNDK